MAGTTRRPSTHVEVHTLLFLKNVDHCASESFFRDFLTRKYLPSPTTVTFHHHRRGPHRGRRSGAAFVSFATASDARHVLNFLHGRQFNRRTLSVSYYQAEPRLESRRFSHQEQCQDDQCLPQTNNTADLIPQGSARIILEEPGSGTTIPIVHLQHPSRSENNVADLPHFPPVATTQEHLKSHHPLLALLNLESTTNLQRKPSTHTLNEWLDTEQQLTDLKTSRGSQRTCFDFSLSDHTNIQRFAQKETLNRKIAYLEVKVLEQALALDFATRFRTAVDRKALKELLSREKGRLDTSFREPALDTAVRVVRRMRGRQRT